MSFDRKLLQSRVLPTIKPFIHLPKNITLLY